jgi:hypothetical protein
MKRTLANKWVLKGLIDGDRSLKPVDKVVAWFILNHYNLTTGKCYPSHKLLAEESGYKIRHVKTATKRLCQKYFRLKRRGHTGSANEYEPVFELIDKNKDVVQYNSKVGAHSVLKRVHYNAPQTIKETIYKTKEDEERELLGKVSFVKKGMYTQRISQVDVQEMLKRGWITEQEFKNYG